MFTKLFRKEKPRVYLNSLAVVPRKGIKTIDEWGAFGREDFDAALRQKLSEIFTLPHVSTITDPKNTDLAIDVVIPEYQGGEAGEFDLGEIAFPIFWRPRVEVRSRLFEVRTNKTISVFFAVQKMHWGDYFSRVFSLRGMFRFRPLFTKEEIEYLMLMACYTLLDKMRKKI